MNRVSRPDRKGLLGALVFVFASLPALQAQERAQETVEQRLQRLEQQNRELQRQLDSLGREVERNQLGGTTPPLAEKRLGEAQGANKVQNAQQGLSIGGYGEFEFTQVSGGTDTLDAVRAVLYFGYRFDDRWLFNSEIEVEHGGTEANSGTTDEGGSVSLEFGYLEHELMKDVRVRAGVLLIPMGLVNEDHEPTSFLPANRSQTETRILPTTWSEPGIELLGEVGGFQWRTALVAGFNGERFDAEGLREGRQGGNLAAADDLAIVVRADWAGTEGLLAGGSVYYGKAGQDGLAGTTPIPALPTTIVEGHVDWRPDHFVVRAQYATAFEPDAPEFDAALGAGLAGRMVGAYGEVGYDVMPWLGGDAGSALLPFVRYEHIDTQRDMPAGVAREGNLDSDVFTIGVHWRPRSQIAIKVDFENWTDNPDQFHVSVGYVF